MKAKLFKFAKCAPLDGISISFIEVVVAQVLIGLLSGNQLEASHQQCVSNRTAGSLFAASGG